MSQSQAKINELAERFSRNLNQPVKKGEISPQATTRMDQFLKSLSRHVKSGPQGRIDIDAQAAASANSVARNFLNPQLGAEFEISSINGLNADQGMMEKYDQEARNIYQEIYGMQPRDPKPKPGDPPQPTNPQPADPQVQEAKNFITERWEEIKQTAACIRDGEWKTHWWGWECGISFECANRLGNQLTLFGGSGATIIGEAIWHAIVEFIKTGLWVAVQISLEGINGVFLVIGLYAFLLGGLIKLINGPAGVWIQGNWPWPIPGLDIPLVWAIPG